MSTTTARPIALTAALAATTFAAAPGASATPATRASTTSGSSAAGATGAVGAVYVLGNQTDQNAVIAYDRGRDGRLTPAGSYPTRGTGTGAGLGSQNAVVLDAAGAHLYAVNAGSDTITSFDVTGHGLRWRSTVPSGGDTPISISVRGDRAYALNAGGDGNISGFAVNNGRLRPLAGSTRTLSGSATDPAQVSITPNGDQVVVTEKATNLIDLYALNSRGVSTSRTSVLSAGTTPFGFAFTPRGQLAVSEAGASTASTYGLFDHGLRTISGAVGNTEAAACWLVVTENGKFAYTGNGGGSQSISGYAVKRTGALSLLTEDGRTGTAAGGVSDIALTQGSGFLYARLGDGTVGGYAIGRDGGLTAVSVASGLPAAGAAGIAAR